MAGYGCGFLRDSFHHAAVAGKGINVVIDHVEFRAIEVVAHPTTAYRHTNARCHTLTQRPCGCFDAGRPSVLWVSGTLAVELSEPLDVIEGDRQLSESFVLRVDRFHSRQVQH